MKKGLSILVEGNRSWIGGLYYKRNIIFSLLQNENICNEYRIIVFADKDIFEWLECFKNRILLLESKWYLSPQKYKIISSILNIKFDFVGNPNEDRLNYRPKLIYWIPDFQHNYYPNYFTEDELKSRDKKYNVVAESNLPVIFSSKSAKEDFCKFYVSEKRENIFVVPFVSYIEPEVKKLTFDYMEYVLNKYSLNNYKLICISNQFWQHKNHILVFKAISILVNNEFVSNVKFVFTGELKDNRNLTYYNELKSLIMNHRIEDKICITGFIDRQEQLAIMKASEIILQPSLFEGWGTTVEDAKVLNKTVLLSDIPVHHEQKNENCILFDPNNPEELSDLILAEITKEHNSDLDRGIKDMYKRAEQYSNSFYELLNLNG